MRLIIKAMKRIITGHNQKVILKILQRGPMHYSDVADQMNMHDSSKIKISMERLVKKGILKKQNNSVYSL